MNLTITISEAQKKILRPLAEPIKSALAKIDVHRKRYAELMAKDRTAEKQVAKHQRAAAGFEPAAELQLIAALKQRERLREALTASEENAAGPRAQLWRGIDVASSALHKILQGAHEELLNQIVSESAKFFDNADSLRFAARDWPVVRSFVHEMLQIHVAQNDSSELLVSVAEELLRRIESLTDGKLEWSYQGAAK